MYLAKKNISYITNFEKFCNLEVLWLNGNKVKGNFSFRNLPINSMLHFKHATLDLLLDSPH
jgi:hypothetical protein